MNEHPHQWRCTNCLGTFNDPPAPAPPHSHCPVCRATFREDGYVHFGIGFIQHATPEKPRTARRQRERVAVIDDGVPSVLFSTIYEAVSKDAEGEIIRVIPLAWSNMLRDLLRDEEFVANLTPRQWEEIVAAAYERAGFDEVKLTPRSRDGGRDVIAVKRGLGTVRVVDQVKAYKPGHLVTADEVRALAGVVLMDPLTSKGFVTTTSDFAPRILDDPLLKNAIPKTVELVNRDNLFRRLRELGAIDLGSPTPISP